MQIAFILIYGRHSFNIMAPTFAIGMATVWEGSLPEPWYLCSLIVVASWLMCISKFYMGDLVLFELQNIYDYLFHSKASTLASSLSCSCWIVLLHLLVWLLLRLLHRLLESIIAWSFIWQIDYQLCAGQADILRLSFSSHFFFGWPFSSHC